MPYTERQLRCLSAMGIVAWRLREPPDGTFPAGEIAVVPSADGAPGATGGPDGNVAEGAAPGAAPGAATSRGHVGEAAAPGDVPPGAGAEGGTGTGEPMTDVPGVEPPDVELAGSEGRGVGTIGADTTVDGTPGEGSPPVPPVAAPAPLVAPALATPLPRESAALAAWLPDQPLAPFTWKERRLTRIGRDDAPLLVVVEREPDDGLPLAGPAAELFERMLESIGRSRRDTCQCVLASEPQPGGDTLAALAGAHRPATLVLLQELEVDAAAASLRLPGDPFGGPAWCLPHPERLLAEPHGKRLAWDVLKALRAHLAGPIASAT